MKIIGSRSGGRRVAGGSHAKTGTRASGTPARTGGGTSARTNKKTESQRGRKAKKGESGAGMPVSARKARRKKRLIIAGSVLLLTASAIMLVLFTPLWDSFFRPGEGVLAMPGISRPNFGSGDSDRPALSLSPGEEEADSNLSAVPIADLRSVDRFTFLILGIDGTANTDVIMVASFDSEEHTLEIVNIPRDTMVNVSWNVRKVNSIQAVMRNRYRNEPDGDARAMEATVEHFSNLLGFHVDFWVTINMRGFINLIDAIGGVQFDVPVAMNWNDPEAGLRFQLSRGPQRVNGNNALGLMRFRGYADGDLRRIRVQQDFLLAAARQLLAGVNAGNITTFIDTFLSHVRTDIQMNNLIWLGREFLNINPDNINFSTMPGNSDQVAGGYYISLILDEWLDIVNNKLSPLHSEITAEDVSILTRGEDRRLFVTDGNWQGSSTWGQNSRGPFGRGN